VINFVTLFNKLNIKQENYKDLHVLRFFSSYIAVSNGKVIGITDPHMEYCPLAGYLYKKVKLLKKYDIELIKEAIKKAVKEKISRFGFFTDKRKIIRKDIAIPCGASEMLMFAIRKRLIDAAVVVCDGAGTVIVDKSEIVQGIGARMNGLFFTSPIYKVMRKLRNAGCHIVFNDANINQIKGVEAAVKLGYKKIAVTINACMNEDIKMIKRIEREKDVSIISLIVCTTGINKKKVKELKKYADIVWSCASEEVRNLIGKESILQISKAIPVFVLTQGGLNLVSGYSSKKQLLKGLDLKKQYLISGTNIGNNGKKIMMGNYEGYLSVSKLPVRSSREPRLIERV